MLREAEGHDVGELADAALGDAVGRLVDDGEPGVDRAHVDDGAGRLAGLDLLDHAARDRLPDQERALQVHPQDLVEIGLGEVEELGAVDDAGIVDEDVDVAAEGLPCARPRAPATEAASPTSAATKAVLPVLPISSAVALPAVASMSERTTLAPSAANRCAMALPMPRAAPVTMATLPSSAPMVIS
jgi:hypothetical protein